MKIDDILAELEQAAKQLSVRVTYEAIGGELGAGGLCKVKGEWRVIIDKRATPAERAAVLAQALVRFPTQGLSLSKETAAVLEQARPLSVRAPVQDPVS